MVVSQLLNSMAPESRRLWLVSTSQLQELRPSHHNSQTGFYSSELQWQCLLTHTVNENACKAASLLSQTGLFVWNVSCFSGLHVLLLSWPSVARSYQFKMKEIMQNSQYWIPPSGFNLLTCKHDPQCSDSEKSVILLRLTVCQPVANFQGNSSQSVRREVGKCD